MPSTIDNTSAKARDVSNPPLTLHPPHPVVNDKTRPCPDRAAIVATEKARGFRFAEGCRVYSLCSQQVESSGLVCLQ